MPSFDRPADADIAPSAWVIRFAPLIVPGGLVLDLACGHGRHARHLLSLGFRVIAADIDASALAGCNEPGLTVVERDLEDGSWPWEPEALDGVVVTNYLHRPHFRHIAASLRGSGVLIFETFGAGNEKLGRPRNPDFLLQPGELLQAFAALQVIAYEHGIETHPRPTVRQRLCAVRATEPVALDQHGPELGLQLPQARAQRRLGDETGLGRPREIAVLRKNHQVVQLPEGGQITHVGRHFIDRHDHQPRFF